MSFAVILLVATDKRRRFLIRQFRIPGSQLWARSNELCAQFWTSMLECQFGKRVDRLGGRSPVFWELLQDRLRLSKLSLLKIRRTERHRCLQISWTQAMRFA